ncbi:MAG: hypothetical protein KC417_16990, partial [Myxococcales bacterium]|nr:hypothetical protein [Myxococcales bacterium]
MRFSRFERKIVVALLAVGFAPLVAALLLGRGAVREAYEVGVNNRIRRELESSLRLYTDHLRVLRDNADLSKELVEADPELGLRVAEHDLPGARARAVALMGSHPNVVRIQVAAAGTPALDVDRHPAEDDTWRLLELEGALAGAPGTSLTVTTATPWAPFHAHHRAAEIVKVYDALEAETAYVTTTYLGVFIILLFAVIVAAVAVG